MGVPRSFPGPTKQPTSNSKSNNLHGPKIEPCFGSVRSFWSCPFGRRNGVPWKKKNKKNKNKFEKYFR